MVYVRTHNTDAAVTPVVFVHGAGGSHEIWRHQFDLLPNQPTFFLDLPGHGQTEGPAFSDVADTGNWLKQWMAETFGEKPVILVGHSMGGAIAQWMALHAPERIKAIVLVTTGARLKVDPAFLQQLEQGQYDPERIRLSFSPHTDEAVIQDEIQRRKSRLSVETVRNDFVACDRFDVRNDIQRIACPTLIIAGEDDPSTPPKFSAFMAEHIPNAQLVVLPQAGHYVMLEQTERFNHELKTFIEKQSDYPASACQLR